MSKTSKAIAIVGAGRLARAVGLVLDAGGHDIRLLARNTAQQKALHGLLRHAVACTSWEEACRELDLLFLAVPTAALPEVCALYAPYARGDQVVLHACRGVGPGFLLPHAIVRSHTCVKQIGVLGGPLYFEEVEQGHPLTAVVASRFDTVPALVRDLTHGTIVHTYPSRDLVGVEVAGAVSNVGLLAAGMADTLGLGDTARGLLLTQSLAEATQLGLALGATAETFTGLAGVGDLIPRRVSSRRHHVEAGRALAESDLAMEHRCRLATFEGAVTALAARDFAQQRGLDLPLMRAVSAVVAGERTPEVALEDVLRRDLSLAMATHAGSVR
ncbi:MAG: NAD(P)H-dependent glycerol-3-phosphate dehydrogenase [Myxococcota bacterium]